MTQSDNDNRRFLNREQAIQRFMEKLECSREEAEKEFEIFERSHPGTVMLNGTRK